MSGDIELIKSASDYLRELCSGEREMDFVHFEGTRGKFIGFCCLYHGYVEWCHALCEEALPRKWFLMILKDGIGMRLTRKTVKQTNGRQCKILGIFEADFLHSRWFLGCLNAA